VDLPPPHVFTGKMRTMPSATRKYNLCESYQFACDQQQIPKMAMMTCFRDLARDSASLQCPRPVCNHENIQPFCCLLFFAFFEHCIKEHVCARVRACTLFARNTVKFSQKASYSVQGVSCVVKLSTTAAHIAITGTRCPQQTCHTCSRQMKKHCRQRHAHRYPQH
jgi:hypothetical protein